MIEKAMVSMIQCVTVTKVLKYGQLQHTGHTFFVCRKSDVIQIHKPYLASSLPTLAGNFFWFVADVVLLVNHFCKYS